MVLQVIIKWFQFFVELQYVRHVTRSCSEEKSFPFSVKVLVIVSFTKISRGESAVILYGKYSRDYCFFADRPIYKGTTRLNCLRMLQVLQCHFFIFAGELSSAARGRPRV